MVNFFVKKHSAHTKTATRLLAMAVFVLLGGILIFQKTVHAQQATTDNSALEAQCGAGTANQTSQNVQAQKAACQSLLDQLNTEIAQKESDLKNQQGQSQSLTNDIAILKTHINKAKLDIQAKSIVIGQLTGEISDKTNEIQSLTDKIASEKESLAQLLRNTNGMDQTTIVDLLLSENSVSQFYNDIDAYDSIKSSIKNSVDQILGLKTQTEDDKQVLQLKQDQEVTAKAAIEQSKAQIEQDQAQQKQLLAISKDKEKQYQAILADRAQKVAQIQAKLFTLAGGGSAIPFQQALVYAQQASDSTGIRPAFLLAILTQESNLGANVGKCYLTVPDTGEGVRVTSGATIENVMKPSRDVAPFLTITQSLGIDPYKQVVSCPLAGGGYGGAMGPSQFIPSTWMLFKDRLATALGTTPNPWMPRDAFTASALYLTDLGAGSQVYADERNAACKYYSGRRCDNKRPKNSFYGNSVMQLATSIQSDIDYLKQYGVSRR